MKYSDSSIIIAPPLRGSETLIYVEKEVSTQQYKLTNFKKFKIMEENENMVTNAKNKEVLEKSAVVYFKALDIQERMKKKELRLNATEEEAKLFMKQGDEKQQVVGTRMLEKVKYEREKLQRNMDKLKEIEKKCDTKLAKHLLSVEKASIFKRMVKYYYDYIIINN